jgi:DNA-binding CsgD family transcriptional regulator
MSTKPAPERRVRPDTKTPVGFKAQQAEGLTAARIGLILLDSSLKLVYCNSEALRILAYPSQPSKAPGAELSKWIHSIVGNSNSSNDFSKTLHFVSGRRCYLCRTFILEFESNGDFQPTIAITLERGRGLAHDLAPFHLTAREAEVVQHLVDGLTNKEIAQRMNVSTHTVRAFLRLIMIKLGVTTRSAIIGKLITRRDPNLLLAKSA